MAGTNEDFGIYVYQKEAAELLGVTAQSVSKLLRENKIPTTKLGNRLQVIPPASMKKIIKLKGLNKFKGKVGIHIVKGGVGKTTLVHGLGARSAALGHKTLLVDLDQQGNLSHSFGIWPILGSDPTLLNVYRGEINGKKITIRDAIKEITDDLHIIPANLSLANFDAALTASGTENIGRLFGRLFKELEKKYDVILFDCPPALSKITAAIHCYVDMLVLPVNADSFSMEGLQLTLDNLKLLKENYGADPKLSIVLNKFHSRHKMTLDILRVLSEQYGDMLAESFISATKKIENSIAKGECIWVDRNKNNALEDIHNLVVELFSLSKWEDFKGRK